MSFNANAIQKWYSTLHCDRIGEYNGMSNNKQYYLVIRGRRPGVYRQWHGEEGAAKQVQGFSNALYKGFATLADAKAWVATLPESERLSAEAWLAEQLDHEPEAAVSPDTVVMYTDGSALGNPGPGGYGVVLRYNQHYKELSGGFRRTTNNRMELMACIAGLRTLKRPMRVVIYSDSKYVVDAVQEGWVQRWQAKNWMRTATEPAQNADLWAELVQLCTVHQVQFVWVPGHSGVPDNERCHQLATAAAQQPNLPPDIGFEQADDQTP